MGDFGDDAHPTGSLAAAAQVLGMAVSTVERLCPEASLDQKQRLQRTLFPSGVTYGVAGFGTAEASLVFTMLDAIMAPKVSEACRILARWKPAGCARLLVWSSPS